MNEPMGTLRLKQRAVKEGSAKRGKIQYQVQKVTGKKYVGTPREDAIWRMTLVRLEYYPRLKTWRLMETRRIEKGPGSMQGWWKQITLADFGDITEEHACSIALSTLALTGY